MFCNYQTGCRRNHSTGLFLSFLNNQVLKGFDKGYYASMILIGPEKAFDTIKLQNSA